MICKNCGGTFNVIGNTCPHCHVSLKEATRDVHAPGSLSNTDIKSDKLLLTGVLVPIYGIYAYLTNKDTFPRKAEAYKKGSILGLIVWTIIVLFMVLLFK